MLAQKISEAYEEEIQRLTNEVQRLKIKNSELEHDAQGLRSSLSRVSMSIEKSLGTESPDEKSNDLQKAHQELKKKYNELLLKHKQEISRLRTFEANYKAAVRSSSAASVNAPPLGDPADKARIAELENELQSAYDVIEELEFEMDNIGFLEAENERLQNELNESKAVDDAKLADNVGALNIRQSSATVADRRSMLQQKLEVMHNKHNELFDKAKKELAALSE